MLEARETRVRLIHERIRKDNKPVILIKANIPGNDKNIKEAYIITSVFLKEIADIFHIHEHISFESKDGPYHLLSIDGIMPIDLKKKLVNLEEHHQLGRFVDLDLYVDETYSISRVELSLTTRRCYLCDEDARICSKTKKHTVDELLDVISSSIQSYLSMQLDTWIDDAIMTELNLEHKFGLVTPTSKGSHKDMDYKLMLEAKQSIQPFFLQIFYLNNQTSDLNELFQKARTLGLIAEHQMLEKTKGVNAYKGLIFMLGLTVLAYGYVLYHGQTLEDLFHVIQTMTKGISKELEQPLHTHGSKAYHEAHLKGARGEVEQGLPTIKYLFHTVTESKLTQDDLRDILKIIILKTEDTVFYHRAKSLDRYKQIKASLSLIDAKNISESIAFTKQAIEDDISFGGSADLLIVYLFLKEASSYLNKSTLSSG